MNIKEAYSKVEKLPYHDYLLGCYDYGDEWHFNFCYSPTPKIGGHIDVVNKKTGEISTRGTNPEAIFSIEHKFVREIDIKQFKKGKDTYLPKVTKLDEFLWKVLSKKL